MTEPAAVAAPGTAGAHDVVLRATGLSVVYDGPRPTRAVRDVSIELRRGEIHGLAGESGCGKSTLAYAVTRMLRPPALLSSGTLEYFEAGTGAPVDVMALDDRALRRFRWSKVSMVFQSAMNALNPVTSLRRQFDDVFAAHAPQMPEGEREQRSMDLLETVGIDRARIRSYPHELSGGMRQRVVIAMALALRPEVVIMDEPTTALDVVVQREILDEVSRLQRELGFSVLFITHDLSLLLEISDRLTVMYAGRVVESAPSAQVATAPAHPYTAGLLDSFPDIGGARRPLHGIPGSPPDLRQPLDRCAFAERCRYRFAPCTQVRPELISPAGVTGAGWQVACHLHDPGRAPEGPPGELAGRAPAPDGDDGASHLDPQPDGRATAPALDGADEASHLDPQPDGRAAAPAPEGRRGR